MVVNRPARHTPGPSRTRFSYIADMTDMNERYYGSELWLDSYPWRSAIVKDV